jgi:RNA polymerase sigma-70 factor (ECF subfamily)
MTEDEAVHAESVGLALFVALETLTPAERLAFLLHDMFAVPYDEIAPIIGISANTARQLASRARQRVHGTGGLDARRSGGVRVGARRQRELVHAFLAASRGGDAEGLFEVLDQDVALRADAAAVAKGARDLVVGATAVAGAFAGRAEAARAILVDGIAGAVWSHRGVPQIVFRFTFDGGRITAIELLGDPGYLRDVQLTAHESRSEGPGAPPHRQWD